MVDTLFRLRKVVARLGGQRTWDEVAALRAAVARRPDGAKALWALAILLFRRGEFAAAEPVLRRLVELAPDHAEAWLRLAQVIHYGGRFDEAVAPYRRALAVAPGSPLAALMDCGLGQALFGVGEIAQALPHFEAAVGREPDYPEAVHWIARCHAALGDEARAEAGFLRAAELKPDYAEAVLHAALSVARQGDPDRAEAIFRRAIALKPDYAEAIFAIAEIRAAAGLADEAERLCREALGFKPAFAEVAFELGRLLAARGEREEALVWFQRSHDLRPGFAEASLALAEAALEAAHARAAAGDHDRALLLARRALELKPGHAEAALAVAEGCVVAGDQDQALALAQRALELKPDYAEAVLAVAAIRAAAGDQIQALALARRALELKPDYAEAALMVSEGCAIAGDHDQAQMMARRALALNPDYAEARGIVDLLSIFPDQALAHRRPGRRPLICVPITAFFRGWLGGQIYIRNLVRILSALPRARRPRLVVVNLLDDWRERPSLRETLTGLIEADAVYGLFDRARRPLALRPALARAIGATAQCPDGDPERVARLFARVDFTFPLLYPLWSARNAPRPLYWIPDFQQNHYPGFFSRSELLARHRSIAALSRRPVAVVFSSRDARGDYERLYPGGASRAHVWSFLSVPDPASPAEDEAARRTVDALGLPPRFYYTPNQFWRHKDHGTLFRGLRRLADQGVEATFVCTGNDLTDTKDPYVAETRALVDGLELGARVRLLGVLPRPVQMELMRRAAAIIQPSLFEGWSTVVEDTRALGRPLILSDIAVHREQAEDYAVFFRAGDPEALARAVIDTDPPPGPDPAREAAARAALGDRMLDCAGRFLDMLGAEGEEGASHG